MLESRVAPYIALVRVFRSVWPRARNRCLKLTADQDFSSDPAKAGSLPAPRRSRSLAAEREALLGAMIAEVDEHGYAGTSVAGVLTRAWLSRKALYRHFDGKEACFLAAYDEITDASLRAMQSAFEDAAGWPEGAQAAISALLEVGLEHPAGLRLGTIGIAALGAHGIERRLGVSARYEQFVTDAVGVALPDSGRALLVFLASEPAFARLALLETRVAGRRASERFHVAAGGYSAMLTPGFEDGTDAAPPRIAVEASVGAITELCLHHVASGRAAELPELEADATYVALAPFIGAEHAALYATRHEKPVSRSRR